MSENVKKVGEANVPSVLKTVASGDLAKQVEQELKQPDPKDKAKALQELKDA